MRKGFILLCVIGQVAVLAVMAAQRELVLRTGERIHLRTAPVDPRDPFRGDYVELRYELNTVAAADQRGSVAQHRQDLGLRVYAALRRLPGSEELWGLDHLSDQRPAEGLFLAGRVTRDWRFWGHGDAVAVRYGIEKLFVEQGKGIEIEDRQGRRQGMQVPMEVEVAVDRGGTAVVRGFRWSPVGVELELVRFRQLDRSALLGEAAAEDSADSAEPLSPEVRFTLHNVSEGTLWLVDPGDHCAFELVPVAGTAGTLTAADRRCVDIEASREDLVRLDPGASYPVTLDLSTPRWHVRSEGRSMEIGRLEGAFERRFRIVYRPPLAGLETLEPTVGRLWTSELPSRAFTAFGRID